MRFSLSTSCATWHFLCKKLSYQEDPFSIRANPSRGGHAKPRVRREPDSRATEGRVTISPPQEWSSFKGDHAHARPAVVPWPRPGAGWNPRRDTSSRRRVPGCVLDRATTENDGSPP